MTLNLKQAIETIKEYSPDNDLATISCDGYLEDAICALADELEAGRAEGE
jgi:hypothetical protein